MNNKIIILAVMVISVIATANAQNTMRITYNDGTIQHIDITRVDSITFVDIEQSGQMSSIYGEWFWGDGQAGYYELLRFNSDRTFTAEDKYFIYGFTNHTYGTYTYSGISLNLFSNGIGYKQINRWFVTGLTDNALDVMTPNGPFTYYRLQPEAIRLKAGSNHLGCEENENWMFADGVTADVQDGMLIGLQLGTTYVLKHNNSANETKAYKVMVEE